MENPYERYEILLAPVRPTSELWRLAVGLVGFLFLFLVGSQFYFAAFAGIFLSDPDVILPQTTLLVLFHFVVWIAALSAVLHALHKRTLLSLIGPHPQMHALFLRCIWAVMLLYLAVALLPPYGPEALPNPNIEFTQWLGIVPFAIIGLLIQTSAEELLFRGYIQSQLAARFRSPIIWMMVPSFLFASLHYSPAYGEAATWVVIWSFTFGILVADLTARTGSLIPAIALHFGINVLGMLWMGSAEQLGGLALYHSPYSAQEWAETPALLMAEFLILLCGWLVVRIAVRR